jgi:predicted acyl esterase
MAPRLPLVALVLLGPALAGCLGAADLQPAAAPGLALGSDLQALLSEERFGILPGVSTWVPASSDGEPLHLRLFLPDMGAAADWKAPTILVMSPYFGSDAREDPLDSASRPTYFRYAWLLEHFVPRGYAVAFADVRGTGDSGGCLEQTAELQRQDGHDLVEWLAAQGWSNGKVGMFGKSYDAETQQGAAITAPPSLTTIVPVASVSGQYEWNFYDGVPLTLHTLMGNLFYMASDGLQLPLTPQGLAAYPSRPGCHPGMMAQAAARNGDWDPYWDSRELRNGVANIEASVLYVHGLQDWNVRQVALRDWYDQIPSPKRAIFGQWGHDYPEENRWNEDWSRTDWRTTVHAWYDHWLLGVDNGIMERLPPVQVQDSQGTWRSEATYPPRDTIALDLHLGAGALVQEAVVHDPPLLFRENEEAFLRANTPLPIPSAPTGDVQEVLVWESAPFDRDLHLAGWPTLTFDVLLFDGLYPDPDRLTDAHFAANLYLMEGGQETWFNSGYLSARHRDGVRDPAEVPEDEVLTYTLRFHPGDTVLPQGSRLKLTLAGSDAQSEPEGTAWGAAFHRGVLTLPTIQRDWAAVTLDVPYGEPCREVRCEGHDPPAAR